LHSTILWIEAARAKQLLLDLFDGCRKERTETKQEDVDLGLFFFFSFLMGTHWIILPQEAVHLPLI
jgi:hypothetical protein